MATPPSARLLVLLGDPVAHSLSPQFHAAAIAALGLDGVYVARRTPPDRLAAALAGLAAIDAAGNVTIPHKEAAERVMARKTDLCARTGACNTFWCEDGELIGDNTDVTGVRAAVEALGAADGRSWLVIGTGGSARAAAVAAAGGGADVSVRSRQRERGEQFVRWARAAGVRARVAVAGDPADVVVNATPLGLRSADPLPLTPEAVPEARWALDLVYARGETPWVRACRAAGWAAADGRVALVAQGAASFARFFPDAGPPPLEVMRAAVERALRG